MPNERVIPTNAPSDLPSFKIFSEGEQLSGEYHVMSVIVSKSVNKIPYAKLILKDGDPSAEDFPLSNQDFFIPGKNIEIRAGYHGDEDIIFKGIVIKHAIKAKKEKPSLLFVECKDECIKLSVGRKNKYFTESSDSEIIEEICDSYSLGNEVEPISSQHKEMVQYYCTDWDFIVTRSEANGLLVTPDDGELKIMKPEVQSEAALTLTYGATILDFEAEMDARNQFPSVKGTSWDYANQELLESESEDSGISEAGNILENDLADVLGLSQMELKHSGQILEPELQAWIDSAALKSRLSKIRGRAKCKGFSGIKPGDTLHINGVGDRFNGNVFVSGINHEIANNTWFTDIFFGLSPEWFSKNQDIIDTPSAGLLPAINGLHIGIVTQLQDDPDGEDRILVKIPVISNEDEGIWSRVCTLDAGENRGSFFRPEIGDEVIVGFINDDPRDPVILGMLNSSAKPAPIQVSDDNHEKGFVSRSEMKFIFNDDENSIILETPNGNKMKISDSDGGMKLEDENGNFIEMNSSGITIESATEINITSSTDMNIEGGVNTNVSAGAKFKAEGSAGAELSTGAIAKIEGSLVQIN